MSTVQDNITLGRGKVYLADYTSASNYDPKGFGYIGNTPSISVNIENETLDHFTSDAETRVKDASVILQVGYTFSITLDNISKENLAKFFMGSSEDVTVTADTVASEAVTVTQGLYHQLGASATNPSGVALISAVVVKDATDTTTYDINDDYTVDLNTGLLYIVPGGAIDTDDIIHVSYSITAASRERVISGKTPFEGVLKYLANNQVGSNRHFYCPRIKLTPSGEFALKGDDWQTMSFDCEVLERAGYESIYIDGKPIAT